jgi:hypothetical protein
MGAMAVENPGWVINSGATEHMPHSTGSCGIVKEQTDPKLWHQRLGHLSIGGMKRLQSQVEGLPDLKLEESMRTCTGCTTGMVHRLPFRKRSKFRARDVLELVHTSVCGQMDEPSHGGARYFVTFIDDKTRYTKVYFLKRKSEVCETCIKYQAEVEDESGKKIKILNCENGREYVHEKLQQHLRKAERRGGAC